MLKKIINFVLDAIAWIMILFGGLATVAWLSFTAVMMGMEWYELVILVIVIAFLFWRMARWWNA